MKNYVQKGETLTLTAPYAVSSGGGALVGSIFGVASNDYGNGEDGEFQVAGVFDLVRETGASTGFTQGALIYWDNANKRITKTATSNKLIGVAVTHAFHSHLPEEADPPRPPERPPSPPRAACRTTTSGSGCTRT